MYEHKCCTANSVLYNSGIDANKKLVSQRKRKLSFYSNVYIVKNPANPALEGQVMIFRYGQKIFDKLKSVMKPEFEDETPIDPFDLWEGSNFKIKVKTVKESSGASYPNYDDSSFDAPSPLLGGDDEELEKIWNQCYSLQEFISKDKFKSQEELQKKLDFVLGDKAQPTAYQQESAVEEEFNTSNDTEDIMKELEASYTRSKTIEADAEDDDDDVLSQFQALVS